MKHPYYQSRGGFKALSVIVTNQKVTKASAQRKGTSDTPSFVRVGDKPIGESYLSLAPSPAESSAALGPCGTAEVTA